MTTCRDTVDRLGRNYAEIIENWRLITVEKQTDIVVLDILIGVAVST